MPVEQVEIPPHILKARLLRDFLLFSRWFFKAQFGKKFMVAPHHYEMAKALERVANGETTRLIINIPPRYGKTELAVKMFVAWCLANNPAAKFIHLSYSDELALDNSSAIRDLIKSEEFQRLFPMRLKGDSDSKKKWYTEKDGGVYATAAGSAVTGFGAGSTSPRERSGTGCPADGFSGAIIIDDPLKPDDAFSDAARERVNRRFNNTIASRVNSTETPIIVIMQRLHVDDMTGFLLKDGSGEKWEHLCLSAVTDDDKALWPDKHSRERLSIMENADSYTFAGQYRQTPVTPGGNIFKQSWIRFYLPKDLPKKFDRILQSWDFTFKDTKGSDFVVGTVWGKAGANYYLLDLDRARMSFTASVKAMRLMSQKWPQAVSKLVEDKANGPAVLDTLKNEIHGIKAIEPDGSKIARAHAVTPLFEAGNVFIPAKELYPWVQPYIDELTAFPNAKNDDQVDSTTQALREMLGNINALWD